MIVQPMKQRKMADVPRTADNIHIPLPETEALRLMLKVKPTVEMPRPGKHRQKSVLAEVEEEINGPKKRAKKAK
jgi:hypothetical protein